MAEEGQEATQTPQPLHEILLTKTVFVSLLYEKQLHIETHILHFEHFS
jgi:hypothetical protein